MRILGQEQFNMNNIVLSTNDVCSSVSDLESFRLQVQTWELRQVAGLPGIVVGLYMQSCLRAVKRERKPLDGIDEKQEQRARLC